MHLSNQSLLVILLVGIVAGWLAGRLVRGAGFGLVGDLIVGIVGAFIGNWLLPKLGIHLGRDVSFRADACHGRLHRLGHRDKELDAAAMPERGGARGDEVAAMRGDPLLKLGAVLARYRAAAKSAPDAAENIVARRIHRDRP